jgi:ferredoxin
MMSDILSVTIDREECILCGVCYEDCPEVFVEGPDEGLSQIVPEYQVNDDPATGEVPPDLEECVRLAAEDCPVEIIHVEEL